MNWWFYSVNIILDFLIEREKKETKEGHSELSTTLLWGPVIMTTTVCSGRSSSSLPLQLPALIPRGPCCSSFFMIPKPKHSFTPHHHHLNSPALPCTRTTKKKPILTVTNINSNTPTGGGASISEHVEYQGLYGPWTIQPSDVTEVTFSALISHSSSTSIQHTCIICCLSSCPWVIPPSWKFNEHLYFYL